MPKFIQTWALPGAQQFDYIVFDANDYTDAMRKSAPWLAAKISAAGGNTSKASQLMTVAQASKWKDAQGNAFFQPSDLADD